jgi:hypothetical protein
MPPAEIKMLLSYNTVAATQTVSDSIHRVTLMG